MFKCELPFAPNQRVKIKAIGFPGFIDEVSIKDTGVGSTVAMFHVVYWQNMRRTGEWMLADEIEAHDR